MQRPGGEEDREAQPGGEPPDQHHLAAELAEVGAHPELAPGREVLARERARQHAAAEVAAQEERQRVAAPAPRSKQTRNALWTWSTPRQEKYPAAMSEMSSGIGSPKPHSSRIPPSHMYAPSGVRVDRCAMNHFTRGPSPTGPSQIPRDAAQNESPGRGDHVTRAMPERADWNERASERTRRGSR